MVTEKDKQKTINILKDLGDTKCELPYKEKDILEWSLSELKAYIIKETSGMNPKKKLKFAKALNNRIKKRKLNI